MEIWREKLSVTVVAVLSAALASSMLGCAAQARPKLWVFALYHRHYRFGDILDAFRKITVSGLRLAIVNGSPTPSLIWGAGKRMPTGFRSTAAP